MTRYSPKDTIVYHRIYNIISQRGLFIHTGIGLGLLYARYFKAFLAYGLCTYYKSYKGIFMDEMNENFRKVCSEQNVRRDIKLAVSFA